MLSLTVDSAAWILLQVGVKVVEPPRRANGKQCPIEPRMHDLVIPRHHGWNLVRQMIGTRRFGCSRDCLYWDFTYVSLTMQRDAGRELTGSIPYLEEGATLYTRYLRRRWYGIHPRWYGIHPAGTFELTVRTRTGKKITLDGTGDTTIDELKNKIQWWWTIPQCQQQLHRRTTPETSIVMHQGTLRNYGISCPNEVFLSCAFA